MDVKMVHGRDETIQTDRKRRRLETWWRRRREDKNGWMKGR